MHMRTRLLILLIVFLGALLFAANPQSKEQGNMATLNSTQSGTGPRARARAKAKIIVQSSEAKPYDQTANPALMEIRISETFSGDIDGESTARAFQVQRSDHYASQVSMQRFAG